MNDKEKLISLLILTDPNPYTCESESGSCELTTCTECRARSTADLLIAHGVTVQEWINSEEMLPEFPCLAVDVNGNSVFIPDGILTIKDKHGEWCINASLAKEFRLINGAKIDALIWENRIAYWMPIPQPPKGE